MKKKKIHLSPLQSPVKLLAVPFLLLALISCTRCSLGGGTEGITILSYNCENLFDDVDNGTEYAAYDPGLGEWNANLYYLKLKNIAEVILCSTRRGPDIIALQEIENEHVLTDLRDTFLTGKGYRTIVTPDSAESAVRCGFISRFPVSYVRIHSVSIDGKTAGRSILETGFSIDSATLILFNNHWKSKSGGAEETEPQRVEAAGYIKNRISQLLEESPNADIIILGDLNENVDEFERVNNAYQTALIMEGEDVPPAYLAKSISVTFDVEALSPPGTAAPVFYSPWGELPGKGSYMYNSSWETIDHFLLTASLFDSGGFSYSSFEVIEEDFMVNDRGVPLRWNSDLQQGYSDHLPILLTLVKD